MRRLESSLYDLQSKEEERLNILTHGLGLLLSLLALGLLVEAGCRRSFGAALVGAVYGLSLVQLFGISTYYHQCPDLAIKKKARIWDHCAIFGLIAGSYTPYMTLALGGWRGWGILFAVWTMAWFGIRYKCTSATPFGAHSVILYLVMGWLVLLVWTPLTAALPSAGLDWLVAGGVVYSLGIPFYAWQSLPYSHGLWHLFVLGGAVCHFVSVWGFVI